MSDRGDGLGEIEPWMIADAIGCYEDAIAEGKRRKAAGTPMEWFEPNDQSVSRYLDLEDRTTREFLGHLLDLWDREQERIADGGLAPGETIEQWEERMRKNIGYTPLRLPTKML